MQPTPRLFFYLSDVFYHSRINPLPAPSSLSVTPSLILSLPLCSHSSTSPSLLPLTICSDCCFFFFIWCCLLFPASNPSKMLSLFHSADYKHALASCFQTRPFLTLQADIVMLFQFHRFLNSHIIVFLLAVLT